MSNNNDISKIKVPITWTVGIVSFACTCLLFLWNIQSNVSDIRKQQYTRTEMREFADELRSENKDLFVPRVPLEPAGASLNAEERAAHIMPPK